MEALAPYRKNSLNIEIRSNLHGLCRDPKDDMVLECAALASADLIVTARQYLDAYPQR